MSVKGGGAKPFPCREKIKTLYYTLFLLHSLMYSSFILYTVPVTLLAVHLILYTVPFTLLALHFILYTKSLTHALYREIQSHLLFFFNMCIRLIRQTLVCIL